MVIVGYGLAQGVHRQTGAMAVILRQAAESLGNVLRLQLQGLFQAPALGQLAQGAGAGYGVRAAMRHHFYLAYPFPFYL